MRIKTRLPRPLIIILTVFETDHQSYTQNCQKKLCFNTASSPRSDYSLVFLTYLLNFPSSSLCAWKLLSCSIVLARSACSSSVQQGQQSSTSAMSPHSFFHTSHLFISCLTSSLCLCMIKVRKASFWCTDYGSKSIFSKKRLCLAKINIHIL